MKPQGQCGVLIGRVVRLRKFSFHRFLFHKTKMSDKRRRRRQNSDDSEHSEGEEEVKQEKVGGEELDIEKDEGVVRY